LLLHLKGFRTLAGIVLICAILGATLFVPGTAATTVSITVATSSTGGSGEFNYLTTFPTTVRFSVPAGSAPAGSTFLWQFGDGTDSTGATPTHVYASPCVYDAQVQVTAPNGSVASGGVIIGAFAGKGTTGRALAVCPPQGTAGLTPVELTGGFFAPHETVNVTMNGASVATVTADSGGDWLLNVSGILAFAPEPNASQYAFTTSPPSLTTVFTTVEGLTASPASGAPGDTVVVQGRSYPPSTTVQVYLGNVSVGSAQTDSNGSFDAGFSIPDAAPLTTAGTYTYGTLPGIVGSQASFASTGTTAVTTAFSLSSWWLWLLILAALFIVAAYVAWRWQKSRRAPRR
jgi:PKD repeat protein